MPIYDMLSGPYFNQNYQVAGGEHFITSNSEAVRHFPFPSATKRRKKLLANIDTMERRDIVEICGTLIVRS